MRKRASSLAALNAVRVHNHALANGETLRVMVVRARIDCADMKTGYTRSGKKEKPYFRQRYGRVGQRY